MIETHVQRKPLATLATTERETSRYFLFNEQDELCGWRNVKTGDEKLVKPDPAIYELCLQRNKLQAAESLFIDDSMKNVKGAEAVGMNAHHFTTPENLKAELKRLGVL